MYMKWTRYIFILGLVFLCVGTGFCVLPNTSETWDGGLVNGWVNPAGSYPVLDNPGTYLRLSFSAQSILFPAGGGVEGGVDASGGIFSGDYVAAGVTGITFSVMGDGHMPSERRLILRSSVSGREWTYMPIEMSNKAGEWVLNTVPLDYSTGRWHLGGPGASEEVFLEDLRSVGWIGIRFQQSGTEAQVYCLDGFMLQGKLYGLVKGKVVYSGYQSGPVKVMVCVEANSWDGPYRAELSKPGNYEVSGVRTWSNYWFKAYIDTNTNGVPDEWEPMGQYSALPVYFMTALDGIDISLTEAVTPDGLPLWWVLKYFGGGTPVPLEGGGAITLANKDSDGTRYFRYTGRRTCWPVSH